MGRLGIDSDDESANSGSRPPSAFNVIGSRPVSRMGSGRGLIPSIKKLDFQLS